MTERAKREGEREKRGERDERGEGGKGEERGETEQGEEREEGETQEEGHAGQERTRSERRAEEEEEERRSESVLLRGIFALEKKSHDVVLTSTRLTWTPIIPETPTGAPRVLPSCCLLLQDVFAVKVKRRRAAGQQVGGAVQGIALFYCSRKGRSLRRNTLDLQNASTQHTHTWFNTVRDLLTEFRNRPRSLKVFINPHSHRKEAVHIYREHVAPLFKMAVISTDIIITQGTGHALSVMTESPLDQYDGVVCVGGDGLVAELSHSLVLRAQLDAQRPEEPVAARLPLGIIPAGSTNVVSCSVYGVADSVTAALHIILGHMQQVDMCSFWSAGQFVRFGFSAMFGFGGRSLARAEKRRWMPSPRRREYAFVKTLAKLRPEACQLAYVAVRSSETWAQSRPAVQQASVPVRSPPVCPHGVRNQRRLVQEQEQERDVSVPQAGATADSWSSMEGLYLSISVMSIPCLGPHAPRGLAPHTRLANGSAALIAVRDVSRSEFIRHLKAHSSSTGQLAFPFVDSHAVSAVRLRCTAAAACCSEDSSDEKDVAIVQSQRSSSPWNIDGELVEMDDDVLIRLHPRLITLFGEDVDEADQPAASCGCI